MTVPALLDVEVRKKLTPEDVSAMAMRDEFRDRICELVDGELIELPLHSGDESAAGLVVSTRLDLFARKYGGRAFGASVGILTGYRLSNVRCASASYISPACPRLLPILTLEPIIGGFRLRVADIFR